MHEAKLCLSLIDMATRRLADGERVLSLRVEVGELCGVVPEALAGAFPICSSGTRAAGARLDLERKPGRDLVLRSMEVL